MLIEVKVPQLSESVAEATLVSWHKQPGEAVLRDENLIDIETDKVVLELPAPGDGVLVKVFKENGATVTSGEVIAHLDTEAKTAAAPAAAAKASKPAEKAPATVQQAAAAPAVMPAARKLLAESGVDPSQIEGSGRGGRITKADVVNLSKPAAA
ncbi:MAG TPA: biotin/lipoyl-containing protein, partial [Rhodocyclaceae bacterium]|nr:biotin/lipoyl-containing protein [Rhodocyclaceae bacterium]